VGDPIAGLTTASALPDVTIFSAGVGPGDTTDGGRVLNVTALGAD
jgi:phosphoribosylamine-glycine ligase